MALTNKIRDPILDNLNKVLILLAYKVAQASERSEELELCPGLAELSLRMLRQMTKIVPLQIYSGALIKYWADIRVRDRQ